MERLSEQQRWEKRQAEEKANRDAVRVILEKVAEAVTIEDVIAGFREGAKLGLKMLDGVEKDS